MALFTIAACPKLFAQANCTTPPNCILNPGTNPIGTIGTAITAIPDWQVFMGTPIYGPGMNTSTGIQMVSDAGGSGEGVYACYNFQSGKKYKICLWARNTNTVSGGSLILQAHDGSTGSQTISSSPFYVTSYQEQSYTFTANQNFSQLRIYTNHTANSGYSVVFDDITIVEVPVVISTPSIIHGCGSATLTASSSNPLNISWSPSTGLSAVTGNSVIAKPCQTTTYTASYSSNSCPGTNNNNCTKTEQVTVTVQPGTNVTASPSTISACGLTTLTATSTNPMAVTWTGAGLNATTGNTVTARPAQTTTYTATFTCSTGCVYTQQVTVVVQPGTTVTASPSTITPCGSSTLTATSSNPMFVSWSPSTGLNTTAGNTVIANPCKTTTYTASFYCAQNTTTYTKPVTVFVQTNGAIIDSSSKSCGGKIDLRYTGACPGATYKWYGPKNPSSLLSTGPNLLMPSSTPGDMGNYRLIVTTSQGCIDTFNASVVLNCCDIRTDFNMVGINPIRFENTSTTEDTLALVGEWHWTFGDGTGSTVRSPAHRYAPMANYEVCLTAVIPNGLSSCCDKICKQFYVPDIFECQPKASFDYRVVNPGTGAVQFLDKSAVTGTACDWVWKVDGVIMDTIQNPVIVVGSGRHQICLEVTNCVTPDGPCVEEFCEDIIIP